MRNNRPRSYVHAETCGVRQPSARSMEGGEGSWTGFKAGLDLYLEKRDMASERIADMIAREVDAAKRRRVQQL
jgi:hypothetical protein